MTNKVRAGFTLVELMVVAPIVILLIGSFVALIVNLTGEVLSSRGSNVLTHDVQDALSRIEQDIKLSTTYLAETNIDIDGDATSTPVLAATRQGYARNSTEVQNGSIIPFSNIAKTGGSNASLILNSLVTNGNPQSSNTSFIYLPNTPNSCNTVAEYSKNTPMSSNIVYFVDSQDVLWRRTIMPSGYDLPANRCGSAIPWQQPSCAPGYVAANAPFCKANDMRLAEGVKPADFQISYYGSPGGTAANTAPVSTTDTTAAGTAARNVALQSTPTVSVSITSTKTVAGREISASGVIRATRLEANASAVTILTPATSAPAAPRLSSSVSNGSSVVFTWPRVDTASSYRLEYRINGGTWQVGGAAINNDSRSVTVSTANHLDTVEGRVRATNAVGTSGWGTNSIDIPLWAPLVLQNGWGDFGSSYSTAAYTKTATGLVVLKGLIKDGTNLVATLPAGYRPERAIMLSTTSIDANARLDIESNGSIYGRSGTSSSWLSLDGVAFMPSGTTFTPFNSYQNSWTTFSTSWNDAGYFTDSIGRIHTRGLIRSGTTNAGTPMVTVPTAIRPSEYSHLAQVNTDSFGHISYAPSAGALVAKNGNNGFVSLNSIYYLPSRATGTNCTTQWCNMPLVNGWVWYNTPYSTPQYTKSSDGLVLLKGLVRSGTNGLVTTLPAGYCPRARSILSTTSADAHSRLDVIRQSNGTCQLFAATYNASWISFDSLHYIAE